MEGNENDISDGGELIEGGEGNEGEEDELVDLKEEARKDDEALAHVKDIASQRDNIEEVIREDKEIPSNKNGEGQKGKTGAKPQFLS